MSKKRKLLGSSWGKFSPSSASSSSSPTLSSLDSPSSSSSVSNFSVNQTSSNGKAMEAVSDSDNADEKFLGLPFELWVQIFRYAGMICRCNINLVTVNHRPVGPSGNNLSNTTKRAKRTDTVTCALRRSSSFQQPCAHTSFLAMLAVSSQARQVTRKAIFQEFLLRFSLKTMEDLMGLKQTLRGFARMPPLENSLKGIQVYLGSYDGRQLKGTDKKKPAINLYKKFCDYVGEKLQGTLRHYVFECRVADETVTRELAEKMRNNFRMLGSCAFRFEYSGLGSILGIASNAAAESIMCKEYMEKPFRFMDLPNEIKEMILKELLVNRWDKMRSQEKAKHRYIHVPRNSYEGLHFVPYDIYSCCSDCSAHSTSPCCCASRAAYSTSCTCYTSPLPIFLTSNFMYSMTSYIFFTRNTFVFDLRPSQTIEALSKIPQKHTQLIRHIVMYVSPPWDTNYYIMFVNSMHNKFDLTHLTVDITLHIQAGSSPFAEALIADFITQFKLFIAQFKLSKADCEQANSKENPALP